MSFKLNISAAQFAHQVGCSITHARVLIRSNVVNAVKVASVYKFSLEEINAYMYSIENSLEHTPVVFTRELLEENLIDYPGLITTKELADFFDINDRTAANIMRDLPSIFYGRRGGYKIRKAIFIDYILENQTIQLDTDTMHVDSVETNETLEQK